MNMILGLIGVVTAAAMTCVYSLGLIPKHCIFIWTDFPAVETGLIIYLSTSLIDLSIVIFLKKIIASYHLKVLMYLNFAIDIFCINIFGVEIGKYVGY